MSVPQPVSRTASELGESPLWHARSNSLLWVDITGRRLHCLAAGSGEQRSWPLPEEPGCLGLVAGGNTSPQANERFPAEVVLALRSGFHLFRLHDRMLIRLTDSLFDTGRYRFNDGKVDPAGRFWAGSLVEKTEATKATEAAEAGAGLYCLDHGQARAITGAGATVSPWRDWGVRTSNGLAFSPDGRTMYHSDTPAHVVYAYDFDAASGSIDNRRQWWHADADRTAPDYGGRPDGAAVDVEGCYWTAQYEGARVLQLSPAGEVLRAITVPARCPTMVAFGGDDLKTLYITSARQGRSAAELQAWPSSGFVFAVPVTVAGLPANEYRR